MLPVGSEIVMFYISFTQRLGSSDSRLVGTSGFDCYLLGSYCILCCRVRRPVSMHCDVDRRFSIPILVGPELALISS